jgi:hypothetical protein
MTRRQWRPNDVSMERAARTQLNLDAADGSIMIELLSCIIKTCDTDVDSPARTGTQTHGPYPNIHSDHVNANDENGNNSYKHITQLPYRTKIATTFVREHRARWQLEVSVSVVFGSEVPHRRSQQPMRAPLFP